MRRLLLFNISNPSVFSVIYLNRMNRDFVVFRGLSFSEFRAEFHTGLIELTIRLRTSTSANRPLEFLAMFSSL